MGKLFWIKRFVIVALIAFMLLAGVHLFKGHSLADALWHGVVWGGISSLLFTGAAYYRYRKNQHCALCQSVGMDQGPDHPV